MGENLVLVEAKRLYALGFAIHWLRPKSKIPVESGWTTGPRKEWGDLIRGYALGYNIGVRLGAPSRIGRGYLAVIDVDIKHDDRRYLEEALSAARQILKGLKVPTVKSGFGNGSRHYYVVTEQPFKTFNAATSEEKVKARVPSKPISKREREALTEDELKDGYRIVDAWQVSLYSDGRQVVLPPSIHPDSGEAYQWGRSLVQAASLPLIDLESVPRATPGSPGEDASPSKGSASKPTLDDFTESPVELEWCPISDEVRAGIVEGTSVRDRSAYLLKASSALYSAGLTQNEVLTVLTDPTTFLGQAAYEHAQTRSRRRAAEWVYRYTARKIEAERNGAQIFAGLPVAPRKLSPKEQKAEAEELAKEQHWTQRLDRTAKGKTAVTLKNLDIILTNSVEGDVFIEDLFAVRTEYGCDTPWRRKKGDYLEDKDLILIKRWFADTQFGIEPSKESLFEATTLIGDRCQRHPVREWLDSLKWDGEKRVDTWLRDYCQARAEEPYLSEVSRKFLLAMVTRVFRPGCQWDYMVVLEGKQGQKKSTMARILAGDRWFMDNIPPLADKDAMLNLHGKWLIELPELASVKHTDFNQVKAYITRRIDTVRPHYGRLKTDIPRQSVFIGTVNEGQYFKDPTGNRRYWPVKVGDCDAEKLAKVRDQLFAETMSIYRKDRELLMLSAAAEVQAKEAQAHRRVDDDESEMREALLGYLESVPGQEFHWEKFRTKDLMMGPNAPWGPWNIAGKGYLMNIASQVLTQMAFERFKGHGGQRFWRKKSKT